MESTKIKGMNDIITYAEYLECVEGVIYTIEEREKINETTPDWFHKYQRKAIRLMNKVVPQVHCLPRNRLDFLDLKEDVWQEYGSHLYHYEAMNYKMMFRDALAEQIRFMHDEEITIDNGYMNATNSVTVGGYNQSQTPMTVVNKIVSGLHPSAHDNLEDMGWLYASLSHRIDRNIYYKNEIGLEGW